MGPGSIQLTGPGIRFYQSISSQASVTNETAYSIGAILQCRCTIGWIIKTRAHDQFCVLCLDNINSMYIQQLTVAFWR